MFYHGDFTPNKLRFGDIIKGYVESILKLEQPLIDTYPNNSSYYVESYFTKYSVIMSPCCNIKNKIVALTPLLEIPPDLFKNPNFRDDFTILNEEIEQEKMYPHEVWKTKFTEEQRQERKSQGKNYEFKYYFFYYKNDLFSEYKIHYKGEQFKSRFYMIDFRHIYPLRCEGITRSKIDDIILKSKCLELTPITRKILREKLAYYFGRPAEEDEIILSSI
ncbi:MAG: hypothetical protein ACFFC3_11260 [Candidatus Odinarchaeota archaeon]